MGTAENKNIKKIEVREFTCHCEQIENCEICDPPSILVETIHIINEDDPAISWPTTTLHRLEGKSKDYVEGFTDALKTSTESKTVNTYIIKKGQ